MKILKGIVLCLVLVMMACSEDNEPTGENVLSYDGNNQTAPTLPPGLYEHSARFPSVITRNVVGRSIESVSFYLYEVPASTYILISNDQSSVEPGPVQYSQDISSGLIPNSWNTVSLTDPYPLDGSAVWVSVEVEFSGNPTQTVGCDAGPANPNGDWLYDGSDQQWRRFEDRVGESINWNIRAILSQ